MSRLGHTRKGSRLQQTCMKKLSRCARAEDARAAAIKSDMIKSDMIESDTIKSDSIKSDMIKSDTLKLSPSANLHDQVRHARKPICL